MSWKDGEWGFCKHCGFLVPIVPIPFEYAGCLEPHSAGKYNPRAWCERSNLMPGNLPANGEIYEIRRMDSLVMARINKINDEDPRDD